MVFKLIFLVNIFFFQNLLFASPNDLSNTSQSLHENEPFLMKLPHVITHRIWNDILLNTDDPYTFQAFGLSSKKEIRNLLTSQELNTLKPILLQKRIEKANKIHHFLAFSNGFICFIQGNKFVRCQSTSTEENHKTSVNISLGPVLSLKANNRGFFCAITEQEKFLYCWKKNNYNQLLPIPLKLKNQPISSFLTHDHHICVITKNDPMIFCWSFNETYNNNYAVVLKDNVNNDLKNHSNNINLNKGTYNPRNSSLILNINNKWDVFKEQKTQDILNSFFPNYLKKNNPLSINSNEDFFESLDYASMQKFPKIPFEMETTSTFNHSQCLIDANDFIAITSNKLLTLGINKDDGKVVCLFKKNTHWLTSIYKPHLLCEQLSCQLGSVVALHIDNENNLYAIKANGSLHFLQLDIRKKDLEKIKAPTENTPETILFINITKHIIFKGKIFLD